MENILVPRYVSFSPNEWDKLEAVAREKKTSKSALVRKAVDNFLTTTATEPKIVNNN